MTRKHTANVSSIKAAEDLARALAVAHARLDVRGVAAAGPREPWESHPVPRRTPMPADIGTRDEVVAELHEQTLATMECRAEELRRVLPQLDLAEVEARDHLDDIIGRRTRITALITDLEQLLAAHQHRTFNEPAPNVASPAVEATTVAPSPATPPDPPGDRYEQAAAVARAAWAAGEPMNVALLEAGHAGTLASAQQFLSLLRKRGHDIPNGRTKPTREEGEPAATERPSLLTVAETYKAAVAADRKPIAAIIDRWECTRQEANAWVAAARQAGHLPPRTEPVIPAGDVPHQFVPRG